MEVYLTEEERLEALKRWWKENSRSVIAGIAVGVAVVVGWNMWQNHRRQTTELASGVYQQLLNATENKQNDLAAELAQRLIDEFGGTGYAPFARLFLAKLRVEANDLAGAEKILESLLAEKRDPNFQHIARLRLGQVLLASGQSEAALNLMGALNAADQGEFAPLYQELKGDIYVALGRHDDARAAYQQALLGKPPSLLLELKLNELPPQAASS